MLLQLAARQMLRQATAEGSFSTLPCVYVSLQLETSRHAGRRAGSHPAALALHRKLSLRREIHVNAAPRELTRIAKLRMRKPSAEHP